MEFLKQFINSVKFNDFKIINIAGKVYVVTMLMLSILSYIGLAAIQL